MEIREQIEQRECELHHKYYDGKYGWHRWDKLPPLMRTEIHENAGEFLSLTLKRGGGVCPECKGIGELTAIDFGYPSSQMAYKCSTCKGTGKLEPETITLGELIERWENETEQTRPGQVADG